MKQPYSGMSTFAVNEQYQASFDRYEHSCSVATWSNRDLWLDSNGTTYGYCHTATELECSIGRFALRAGMYFSVPGETILSGGSGFTCTRLGYRGLFSIGGPVEAGGRLPYIDGCSDTVLIAPTILGDPCFNFLKIPAGIDQTAHTHPTIRVGMIVEGAGVCKTPSGDFPLLPGRIFVLHADEIHSFHTAESYLRIVIFHPDSDCGPSRESHPMLNRTIVNGRSANQLDDIRTQFAEISSGHVSPQEAG